VAGETSTLMQTRRFIALLWLLSGLPVGVALILLPRQATLACFALFVLLETGHNLAPILLAWTHSGFRRQVIYRSPLKFIALPCALLAVALAIGSATALGWTSYVARPGSLYRLTDWTNLLPVAMWIYWPWKIYHFGMQNFGVLQIYKMSAPGCSRGLRQRLIDKSACLGLTAFGMAVVPALNQSMWVAMLAMGVFSVNHWIVDIGLSSRTVGRRWVFVGIVLLAGAIGFVWIVPTSTGMMIRVIPIVICLRLFLGFTHFFYSRWVWKLTDPLVRATIGQDLFDQPEAAVRKRMALTGAA
jgi:hypothetical protein